MNDEIYNLRKKILVLNRIREVARQLINTHPLGFCPCGEYGCPKCDDFHSLNRKFVQAEIDLLLQS